MGKHLSAPRRFNSVVLEIRSRKGILHLGSITGVRLNDTKCKIISHLGKRPATTVTICRLPKDGSLSISGRIHTHVTRLTRAFPTKIGCGIALSAASIMRSSVSRIVGAFIRTVVLIILIVFFFLRD